MMTGLHETRFRALVLVSCLAVLVSRAAAQPPDEGPTGRSQQPLVTAAPVILDTEQEQLGLVEVRRAGFFAHCSGVLLTNTWVATAAHCVDNVADRTNPATLEVRANWRLAAGDPRAGLQVHAAAALYTAWGSRASDHPNMPPATTYDVALIRLARPVWINGAPLGFEQAFEPGGLGDLTGVSLRVFGRGINQWAGMTAGMPVQSSGDRQYRGATFTVTGPTLNGAAVAPGGFANLLEFPSSATQSVAGGDSGGPSFRVGADGISRVVGVNARCGGVTCLAGQQCPDTDGDQWRWVTGLSWCADAPLFSLRSAITDLMEQTWTPTLPVQALRVAHTEGIIERDLLLGPLDGLHWAYVQRAVQKMCVNRGFAAGIATGNHVAGQDYQIVCFSDAAGRRFDFGAGAGGPWAFTDPDQVGWAQAGRSAAEICRVTDPTSPGGFHTGFVRPASGIAGTDLGVFCLNSAGGSWSDVPDSALGAAANLGATTWAAASRAASSRCRRMGFDAGGFLNGHEAPGVRGTLCLGEAGLPLNLRPERLRIPNP
jgi:hypothetical protein